MAQVAPALAPTQPQDIPQSQVVRQRQHLQQINLNTIIPGITSQNSFESDRVVKSGRVLKRTRKTKVSETYGYHIGLC